MKQIFKGLIGYIVGFLLTIVVIFLNIPVYMAEGALQLQTAGGRLGCWIAGKHSYDVLTAFMVSDIRQVTCSQCGSTIDKISIKELEKQKQLFANTIDAVSQQLRTRDESKEFEKLR
jgi:hypothetical protein